MRKSLTVLILLLATWGGLTLFVEKDGESILHASAPQEAQQKVLITYSPDPFYNLDERVCDHMGAAFRENQWGVTMATVGAARRLDLERYDAFVFCANTYNWSPDWAIGKFIRQSAPIAGKPVMAITLGSGSTARAQRRLEQKIQEAGGVLLESKSLWLWRPNDEHRMEEENVTVACDLAAAWADSLAKSLLDQRVSVQ
ncbi:hypothetical protein [Lewinella sp. W8]|uniref:flavodoxin family protein n=1 Tax=Lewinella sp. W8 TaxID=2528208 RepID=UPI0010685D35|nr:hypothetical protein [Lewinella sp. W8]MTB51341.1 hypothetical protein [Lewinella sp. W8]